MLPYYFSYFMQVVSYLKRACFLILKAVQTTLHLACNNSTILRELKMISAQHSAAIMAKIKLPKQPHSMVIFLIKVSRSYRDLSSQADPGREN